MDKALRPAPPRGERSSLHWRVRLCCQTGTRHLCSSTVQERRVLWVVPEQGQEAQGARASRTEGIHRGHVRSPPLHGQVSTCLVQMLAQASRLTASSPGARVKSKRRPAPPTPGTSDAEEEQATQSHRQRKPRGGQAWGGPTALSEPRDGQGTQGCWQEMEASCGNKGISRRGGSIKTFSC